ncbi:GNAT family N-acetyltransferase [Nonomuraea indica]|uniref:GNAT family N-acetyltransferase n=1 Tax=Nonomuraea indica TaxID=1581193 RepID=UPI001FE42F34|nr:GNAT family N-acetyltransferase [Nonomuraea indica]
MEIRDLTPDDIDDILDLRKRSFGPVSAADAERWRRAAAPVMAEGRYLGVLDGDRLAASARVRAFTQWWHGRPQPMAGVAGVTVNPEYRGRGVGTRLMRAVVERAAELGDAVSALYPATTPIYRAAGYEHAGAQHLTTLRAEALRSIRPTAPVKLRRMGPADAADVVSVLHRVHGAARASGPVSWDERTWALWLAEEDDFLYLAEDGYLVYQWDGDDIRVVNLVAGSEATARALWSMVGSSSSIAEHVTAPLAPDDPVLWLTRERSKDKVTDIRWMFRVVDLAAAVARRGYPAGVALDATVEVTDPLRPGNTGRWRLQVSGGDGAATLLEAATPATDGMATGAATPVPADPSGSPRLTINGFSALYAGIPTATLRLGGLLSGDDRHDEALDSAFAARPYMLDYF